MRKSANSAISERIAILGHPTDPSTARWDDDQMAQLRTLGFTAVQVNIGWGARPADEPLSLEDVVSLTTDQALRYPQPLPLNSDPSRYELRRTELRHRTAVAHRAGLRTAFNCGIPFNNHASHPDPQPNCILDETVALRYELLLDAFARDFDVDDLWLYTYDQDAWLCSEFGRCPRCGGVPLHRRLTPFLERLATRWRQRRPEGRVCWEPWELSAGQTMRIITQIDVTGLALALHNNSAEAMAALPADRHVQNLARTAADRGLPVILEGFFGAATEEVEPFTSLQSPLTTYRQVRAMLGVAGVTGLKEYYGLDLTKEDPNLRAAALCWADPTLDDEAVLDSLSESYGDPATRRVVEQVWRLSSEAMELYPWDASWFVREVGKSNPAHSLNAATVRGYCADTPSWRSTRGSTFIVIDDLEPDPWLLEDLELRWLACADRQEQAIALARAIQADIPGTAGDSFRAFIAELGEFHRRVLAYAYHCRETNLTRILREAVNAGEPPPAHVTAELGRVLRADRINMKTADLDELIDLLDRDPAAFAAIHFQPTPRVVMEQDLHGTVFAEHRFPWPLGAFSATSR